MCSVACSRPKPLRSLCRCGGMAASSAEIRRPRVLIGVSGSVAAIKLQQLVRELAKFAEAYRPFSIWHAELRL